MADKQKKDTISSALDWVEHRWKIVLGFVVTLVASLSFYLRSKDMKKVLQNANDSHKKELEANKDANKKLSDGLEDIKDKTVEDLQRANEDSNRNEKDLKEKKKKFIEEAKDSDSLASDIADRIGAEFVKKD